MGWERKTALAAAGEISESLFLKNNLLVLFAVVVLEKVWKAPLWVQF